MTRRSYIAEVLSQIEHTQSTPIDDEFEQYLSEHWNDDLEFAGFFAEDYTEDYRETLRAGYNVYYQEEIENGTMKHFDK